VALSCVSNVRVWQQPWCKARLLPWCWMRSSSCTMHKWRRHGWGYGLESWGRASFEASTLPHANRWLPVGSTTTRPTESPTALTTEATDPLAERAYSVHRALGCFERIQRCQICTHLLEIYLT
jgi:hypothetical protein